MKKLAIVSARGIGDGLIILVLANNLRDQFDLTLFSNPLAELPEWFPWLTIKPFPTPAEINNVFDQFDGIAFIDTAPIMSFQQQLSAPCYIFHRKQFDRNQSILANINQKAAKAFNLNKWSNDNGIVIPKDLIFRRYKQRIIIHPTSSCSRKNWPAEKFIVLAKQLQQEGFEPQFVVSPAELPEWQQLLPQEFSLLQFQTLDLLARYVYESGYMIGNDSGIGHIASNLGIPTLSIFGRHRGAILWRPAWGKTEVVLPPLHLPGASLQLRYWKQMISVGRVYNQFKRLLETAV